MLWRPLIVWRFLRRRCARDTNFLSGRGDSRERGRLGVEGDREELFVVGVDAEGRDGIGELNS